MKYKQLSLDKKSEPVSFKLLDIPICNIAISFIDTLKPKLDMLQGLLATICNGAFQTYKAIVFLIDDKNKVKYPLQAQILLRSILDILFNVIYLLDNPQKNLKEFNLAGFRMMQKDLSKQLYEGQLEVKENKSAIIFQKELDDYAVYFQLTKEEKDNIKGEKPFWPVPKKIVKRLSQEKDKHFFDEIYEKHYGIFSDLSHFTMRGAALGTYSRIPDSEKVNPGQVESDAALLAIEFLTMIYSEIQSKIDCQMEKDLRYIWTLLSNVREECREYYSSRYDEILLLEVM
ncbi:MAG: DUF5677 domain-containing protein [Thermodesulfovibrionales bacterium]|nr:DUF5677 domain-containing protein [Thermodesulfovibrionales bacterium]